MQIWRLSCWAALSLSSLVSLCSAVSTACSRLVALFLCNLTSRASLWPFEQHVLLCLSLVAASVFVPFQQLFRQHGGPFLIPSYSEVSLFWNLQNSSLTQITKLLDNVECTWNPLKSWSRPKLKLHMIYGTTYDRYIRESLNSTFFLMGWDRGWVMPFLLVSLLFWGVEYDRPSLNPFFFSEKIFCFLYIYKTTNPTSHTHLLYICEGAW